MVSRLLAKLEQARRLVRLLADAHRSVKDLDEVDSADGYFRSFGRHASGQHASSALDIGCGSSPRNPFGASSVFGVDIRASDDANIRQADLSIEPIPFPDGHFDYITAFDFIEHVPRVTYLPERRFPFVMLMDEIWRALKPGGIFFSRTPMYPFAEAFQDPTHVNIITAQTFPAYFDDSSRLAKMYGFKGSFEIVAQARLGSHLVSVLRRNQNRLPS